MDIFKMANQIANSMTQEDRTAIEGMDMEKMLSHVTQNVFKMMNGTGGAGGGGEGDGLSDFMDKFNLGNLKNAVVKTEEPESEPEGVHYDQEDYILPKTRDIRFDLNVDLEDFYNGKIKKLNIKRKRIIEENGKQKVIEEKKRIIIPIERGMKDEQQIRFEGEADQVPGYKPGDIIITLIENEHPVFQRDNDNLILLKNINIYQLYNYSFNVTHLDKRILVLHKASNDALHLNESLRKITGQGMPVYKTNKHGDLFIRFNLIIPRHIEPEKLKRIKDTFDTEPESLVLSNEVHTLEQINQGDLDDLDSNYFDEESSDSESSVSEVSLSSDSSEESVSVSSDSSEEKLPKRMFKRR
jgi:DnaJ-class molecular chaperone